MTKRMLIITFWPQELISLYNKENMFGVYLLFLMGRA